MSRPLTAAVVGVRGIGQYHAKTLHSMPEYRLVGVCDLNPDTLAKLELDAPRFTDFGALLSEAQPEVVVISTSNDAHAKLALQAVAAGVRGVYCEKPMTVHLADARAMVEACQKAGVALAVNHQRRMLAEMKTMRRLIDEGAIGEAYLVKTSNAGDVLSDGTHAIDSLRFLVGDRRADWVCGQVFRKPYGEQEGGAGFDASGGRRFGHVVEDSAMAVIGFEGGLRAEMLFGELFQPGRWYQDYEVFGSKGRLWRASDGQQPRLRLDSGSGWTEVPVEQPGDVMVEAYAAFAETVRHGTPHPLDGATQGLAAMELVTAIYESARTRQKVAMPPKCDRFPLEAMVAEGAFGGVR